MQRELYPTLDRAMQAARLYLTEKNARREHLADFRKELLKIAVPAVQREKLATAWAERLNNVGRMSHEQAEALKGRTLTYASGHASRSRDFITSWLEGLRGASLEGDSRVTELSRVLTGTLGG